MHGLVHRTLKQYISEKAGERSWETVRERAGVDAKLYLPVTHYEDAEFDALVDALASMSGHGRDAIERDVGYFLAEPFVGTFRSYLRTEWEFEDLLESLAEVADALATERGETKPPTLACERLETDRLQVSYRSDRSYPALAHGLLEGVAAAYDEPVTVTRISETGDEDARFEVRLE
ncbi:heme NO-binding domain-containing protein [Natronobiforma cellulositropha]|uniref:heme NO-binding domain-containing protein n=1 Tax=Natronobiforma cellulositropha TaxID=1679076 RepID=UPI0021D5B822|nr:heme NO-binding domain-containing protein [Natronobiforma cellulositropha]